MLSSLGFDCYDYASGSGINGYDSESPDGAQDLRWSVEVQGSPSPPSTLPIHPQSIMLPNSCTDCKRSAVCAWGPYARDGNPGSSKKLAMPSAGRDDEQVGLSSMFNHIAKNRVKHLYYVLQSLSANQRHDVRSIGFGGLLEMDIIHLSTEMNSWLVEGFNPVTRQFYVNGRPAYVVSAFDVAGVFDLNFNPAKHVLEDDSDPQVRAILSGWKVCYDIPETACISLSEIELVTSILKGGGPDFKRLFVLYVLHSLLTPSSSSIVRVGLLKSLVNVDEIHSLNWAGFVLNELCDSIENYQENGSHIGPTGCILILMIIYFHKCPLQGMPVSAAVPIIGQWSSYGIAQRIEKETLCGGFGKGIFQDSFSWPNTRGKGSRPQPTVVQTLSFQVGDQLPDDFKLALQCHSEFDRAVATIARDVNVVLLAHVDRIHWLRESIMASRQGLSLRHVNLVGACTIQNCLREVVENLSQVVRFVEFRRLSEERVTVADEGSVSVLSDVNSNVHSHPTRVTVGKGYACKMVSRYANLNPTLSLNEIEVADYCIADLTNSQDREPLFHDGICVWLLRMDMRTFNLGVHISPAVITAWARIMNHIWTEDGSNKTACLPLVRKAGPDIQKDGMVENWKDWLGQIGVDLTRAELIFVPMLMRGHYFLLVLNFKTKETLCIDDIIHEDKHVWDRLCRVVGSCVCDLLRKLGDARADEAREFTFEVINPHWSTRGAEADCGLAIMHVIDSFTTYEGNLLGMNLHMEEFKLSLRVSYCSRIVLDKLNLYRPAVLSSVQRFVEEKGNSA